MCKLAVNYIHQKYNNISKINQIKYCTQEENTVYCNNKYIVNYKRDVM